MPYTPEQILDAITKLYNYLNDNFDDIYDACNTVEQKTTLRSLFVSARDAYWKAIKEQLVDNNPTVEKITADLTNANSNISSQLEELKDIAAFLNLCASAVQLAASLATLAAAA